MSQALCAAIQTELAAYFGEVALLTMQLDQELLLAGSSAGPQASLSPTAAKLSQRAAALSSASGAPGPSDTLALDASVTDKPASLTLRKLWLWAQAPMSRLRLIASIVDSVGHLKGGGLAGAVHQFSVHGDPDVAKFSSKLTRLICVPLLGMIRCAALVFVCTLFPSGC